jgi:hypothetical protein
MIEDKFELIKTLFIDFFNEEANKINKNFKDLICIVYVYPPNSEAQFPNCALGLDVVLHNADLDKADNLCLEIYIENSKNKIFMSVKIVWGHPSGKVAGRIFERPIEVNEENLTIVREKLPNLVSKLREQIQKNPRGI